MRKLLICVLLVGALGYVGSCSKKKSNDKATVAPSEGITIIAKVNGEPVFASEVERIVEKMFQQARFKFRGQLSAKDSAAIRQNAFDWSIAQKLLEQEATRQHIEVSDVEIQQVLARLRQQFASDQEFEDALTQDNSSVEKLRQNIKLDLQLQKLLTTEVKKRITPVSQQEALEYYKANLQYFKEPEKVHVRHIFFKVDKNATPTKRTKVRKKAEQVLQLARSGEDFAELAQKYSEDPSASNGGDLGFFARGDMVKPFDETVFQLEVGEISDLVETSHGYHIIKLEEKKKAGTQSFQQVAESIKNYLLQQKQAKAAGNYIEQLKEQADIEYLPESRIFTQGTEILPAKP